MKTYSLKEAKRALRHHVRTNYRSKGSFTDDSVVRFATKMKCSRQMVYLAMSEKTKDQPTSKMLKEIGLKKAEGYVKG